MPDLRISQLPFITSATKNSLFVVVDYTVEPSGTTSSMAYSSITNNTDYLVTGVTSSHTLTWDKTYWGISATTNVDLTLPSTTGKEGYFLIIKDEAGSCGSYRIRLTPSSGTIDGSSYVDMNINYMSLTCLVRGGNWYLI